MSKNKYDHTHQYVRATPNVYKCAIPACTHTISKSIIIGRKASCPFCSSVFTIKPEHIQRVQVHCLKCNRGNQEEPDKVTKPEGAFARLLAEKGL